MRWIIDKDNLEDTREVEFFAIFPYRVGNEIRWWEKVKIKQSYVANYYSGNYWKDIEFIDYE